MKQRSIILIFTLVALGVCVALLGSGQRYAREPELPLGASFKELVGVNSVVNNIPEDMAQVAGWVRDYHKWYWYESTRDVYTWSVGWQQLDQFYTALHSLGIKVMPDVELAPGWAISSGRADGIPDIGQHAEYLAELVRHYGNTIAAVENYNEPDQSWQLGHFPADLFGAMLAQDYQAVKAVDPNMPVVLAGLAKTDTPYWDDANRASEGRFDVINFHWYAAGDTLGGGKNPESGGLLAQIEQMKHWRDVNGPGKPIWITEFGWDTFLQPDGSKSKIYAPEASAANYLLRSIFLMQSRGVEKAFVYVYRDPSDIAGNLHEEYQSAGLVTNSRERDGRMKPGWYFLATLKSVLGDYVFDRIVSDGPGVYHYEYLIPGTSKRAAVLWASDGERDRGHQARYRGPAGTLVVPTDGSAAGTVSITDGDLLLTECPMFVLYTQEEAQG